MLLPAMKKLCVRIRSDILSMTTTAKSGHPTSSLSAVESMATLYFKYLRYDVTNPHATNNDRVIFSKGHASPLLYSLFHVAGIISDKELATYRKFKSVLEGHPTPRFSMVDIATGSLGQGLAVGLGVAIAGAPHVFVLLGDGELSEGAVWEAVMAAGYHKTNSLIAIVDMNALEQSGVTMEQWDTETYRKRFESFGWAAIVVDGHDLKQLDIAYQKALDFRNGPTVIIAKTVKGKGISFLENKHGMHGKVLDEEQLKKALNELGAIDTSFEGIIKKPDEPAKNFFTKKSTRIHGTSLYDKPTTTREGFGKALVRIGAQNPRVFVLDVDLETSTFTHLFHEALPHQFFQCHIAEQLMIGIAAGCAIQGLYPVVSSYGGFLTRAMDQFRMIVLSGISMMVNGSHGGVATGADGPSQMGLEDIALFRALPGSIVVSPADAVSAEKITEMVYGQKGITYIRTTRPILPILYDSTDVFTIGGSHVVEEKNGKGSVVTIIATGVTVHEALKAKNTLEEKNIATRVIDCYSIKPLDEKTIRQAAKDSTQIIVVEDHYPEGGLGEAVFAVLASETKAQIIHLAVRKTPMSGTMEELLRYEGIDAEAIVASVDCQGDTLTWGVLTL
ncbi:MAG: transketolase [Candidatus Gottesmanbacteria bacterium]